MLPLPVFRHHRPSTLREAVDLLASIGGSARVFAGGTDLLPNMKHGIAEPEHLVSISQLPELRQLKLVSTGETEHLVLGTGLRLREIAESVLVRRFAPALGEAASLVGGPHHQNMGTLGGNICLDTRCQYINQTYFWRKALGFCIKKDGTVCHVVRGGSKCVAAASNDTGPALIALEAELQLLSAKGERCVAAAEFYTADGVKNNVLDPGEVVVSATIPIVPGRRSAFEKLRRRGAIDFPLLSVAVRADVDASQSHISALDVVISALGARPRRLRNAARSSALALDSVAPDLAEAAYAECKPLTNLDDEIEWRRDMVRVLVKRAAERVLVRWPS